MTVETSMLSSHFGYVRRMKMGSRYYQNHYQVHRHRSRVFSGISLWNMKIKDLIICPHGYGQFKVQCQKSQFQFQLPKIMPLAITIHYTGSSVIFLLIQRERIMDRLLQVILSLTHNYSWNKLIVFIYLEQNFQEKELNHFKCACLSTFLLVLI